MSIYEHTYVCICKYMYTAASAVRLKEDYQVPLFFRDDCHDVSGQVYRTS